MAWIDANGEAHDGPPPPGYVESDGRWTPNPSDADPGPTAPSPDGGRLDVPPSTESESKPNRRFAVWGLVAVALLAIWFMGNRDGGDQARSTARTTSTSSAVSSGGTVRETVCDLIDETTQGSVATAKRGARQVVDALNEGPNSGLIMSLTTCPGVAVDPQTFFAFAGEGRLMNQIDVEVDRGARGCSSEASRRDYGGTVSHDLASTVDITLTLEYVVNAVIERTDTIYVRDARPGTTVRWDAFIPSSVSDGGRCDLVIESVIAS